MTNDPNLLLKRITALNSMTVEELRERYEDLYGRTTDLFNAPALRRLLAYRIQEIYYGGLADDEKAVLAGIAAQDARACLKPKDARSDPIPGTRFSRLWHGKVYDVSVTEDGMYRYDGRPYKSLSAVAEAITGSKWNGRRFFGVK